MDIFWALKEKPTYGLASLSLQSPLLIPIFFKVPSNFRRNLTIRHPVNGFNTDDASTQFVSHETFLQRLRAVISF
jgi:hypothetical protein